MDVGDTRWAASGSVHRIPVRGVDGALHLCGLDVIGPDPVFLLEHLAASTVVCLQPDEEILRRHPAYLDWLADPAPHEALRLPTEDYLVAVDDSVLSLVDAVIGRLRGGHNVVVHCGAGWGRAGVVAVLLMVVAVASVDEALHDLRAARPVAGPQSIEQEDQIARLCARVRTR